MEQVLVLPTHILNAAGHFHGFTPRVDHYLPIVLDPRHLSFLPRAQAEEDPTHKQLIPYVVIRCGDRIFHYRRGKGGGEARLHALRSIGVGGHINPVDDAADRYRQGLLRELAEEVEIAGPYRERIIGLINDDETPVGQVHLGVVHELIVETPHVRRREESLQHSGFAPLAELRRQASEFETWSQFVLAELASA